MPTSRPSIQIPRWIQLVGLPVLALLAWTLAGTLGHALFLFLTASVIAFLLNPLVRAVQRGRVPRGLAVALVSLVFAAAVLTVMFALGTVVVEQTRSASDRVDSYLTDERGQTGVTDAERDVDLLQGWLDDHGLERIQVREQTNDWLDSLSGKEISGYTQDSSPSPGRGLRRDPAPLLADPDRRDRDLHAARHAEAGAGDRPPLPAARPDRR